MSTQLTATYTKNGEWLQLCTAPPASGPMRLIEPNVDDRMSVVEPDPPLQEGPSST